MQDLIIKIPFNSQRFMENQKIIWNYSNRKFIKTSAIYTLIAILVLTMGLNTEHGNSFPFSTALGLGYLFYIIMSFIGYIERRIRFFKKTDRFIKANQDAPMDCHFIFNDYGIEYQDKEKTYKLSWHLFKPSLLHKGNILLILKDQVGVSFLLNKDELATDQYFEVRNLLNDKLGRS